MEIVKTIHENVNYDGTFSDNAGAVETGGCIRMSEGGCDIEGCNCSPGQWICISLPREHGRVEVVTVNFDSPEEFNRFLRIKEMYL